MTPFEYIEDRLKTDKDISWWRKAQLIYEYHLLKQDDHGKLETKTGRPKKGQKVWGVRNTAIALNCPLGYTSNNITLAKAIEKDEGLKQISSFKLAVRKLGLRK